MMVSFKKEWGKTCIQINLPLLALDEHVDWTTNQKDAKKYTSAIGGSVHYAYCFYQVFSYL